MRFKLIACEVFTREICSIAAVTPHLIDMEFTEKDAHNDSARLREALQRKIDQVEKEEKKYDAILLAYGLCGNATVNLRAKGTRLIIPRAHDCCTLFLGSKEKFKGYFSTNPSLAYSSTGYCERGDSYLRSGESRAEMIIGKSRQELVEIYGPENAEYIWETISPPYVREGEKVVFIEIPETKHLGYADKCRAKAEQEKREYHEIMGSARLFKKLLYGEWNREDFLVVAPNQRTFGIYDWDEIIGAEDL
mgnify:CR=1 FL=1